MRRSNCGARNVYGAFARWGKWGTGDSIEGIGHGRFEWAMYGLQANRIGAMGTDD